MSIASTLLGTAAAVTLLVASAARSVSANDCALHGTCCFGPPPVTIPWKASGFEARFERLVVGDAGLQRWAVRRSLDRQAGAISACFDRDGAIDAAVFVTFVVGESGHVRRADATSKHSRLATCVAAAWVRITFPATHDFALTQATVSVTARAAGSRGTP